MILVFMKHLITYDTYMKIMLLKLLEGQVLFDKC